MSELRFNRDVVYVENPPFPKNMLIEVTNSCNHSCVFCNNKVQNRKLQNCDAAMVFRLLEEGYFYGAREVGFYGLGEPFLVSNLEDYVYRASNVGYKYIYITTNGAFATADRLEKLVKNGLSSIKFSINAGKRETYEKVHGRDDFDVVKKNVLEIFEIRKKLEKEGYTFSIFASFVENDLNKGEFELLQGTLGSYIDRIYKYPLENLAGYNFNSNIGQSVLSGKIPCAQLFNRFHVNSAGCMVACCYDYDGMMSIVDLHEMSMIEAWNCNLIVNLRRQHINGKVEKNLCMKCLYMDYVGDVKPLNAELYMKGLQVF